MKDARLESVLNKLKSQAPVNLALKKELRKTFEAAAANRTGMKSAAFYKRMKIISAIAAAALVLVTLVLPRLTQVYRVSASSLQVHNHIFVMDIGCGGSLGVTEYKGTLYVPVSGGGLFAYNNSGFHKIYDKEVSFAKISPDGTRLALSTEGTLGVLDIRSGRFDEILKGNDNTYYEEPSWSSDGKRLVYSEKVPEFSGAHGISKIKSQICEINLDTLKTRELASGSYPSFLKKAESIVFEKDGKIMIRQLKDGREDILDTGRFPSVDPTGNLVAYVKDDKNQRLLTDYASVAETLANIWVADTLNTGTSKKVTSNYPYRFTDEEKWLDGLDPSQAPQVLTFQGVYSYYNPVWCSDSNSLLALKNSVVPNHGPDNMRLVRIDFSQQNLSEEDVVRRFMQALIQKDEDYARTLMKAPADRSLTMSNPRQVGYSILSTGDENGRTFVEAATYWQYTAQPYYRIEKTKYYFTNLDGRCLIDDIVAVSKVEVFEKNGLVYLNDDGVEKVLFGRDHIPNEILEKDVVCSIFSLAYDEDGQILIMAIQSPHLDNKEVTGVGLLVYDVEEGSFRLINTIKSESESLGASKLILDPTGRYLAVDLFSQYGREWKSEVYVCDLQGRNLNTLHSFLENLENTKIESVVSAFWYEDGLLFTVRLSGQTMSYVFEPDGETKIKMAGTR